IERVSKESSAEKGKTYSNRETSYSNKIVQGKNSCPKKDPIRTEGSPIQTEKVLFE
ncbi:hypothetical protein GIB67_025868, partial [Kingdonia uniflora]